MKRARIAWLVLLALAVAYEVYAVLNAMPGDTLSDAVWGIHHPMVAFVAGVVAGHLWWQRS